MQVTLHDAMGSAIQQHCRIVGQDSSDRPDSDSESEACTTDSWSGSDSDDATAAADSSRLMSWQTEGSGQMELEPRKGIPKSNVSQLA